MPGSQLLKTGLTRESAGNIVRGTNYSLGADPQPATPAATHMAALQCKGETTMFPFSSQAKPAYWGIVDPKQLPGYGLSFAISSETDDAVAQVWTVTATNGDVGPAHLTRKYRFHIVRVTNLVGQRLTPSQSESRRGRLLPSSSPGCCSPVQNAPDRFHQYPGRFQ